MKKKSDIKEILLKNKNGLFFIALGVIVYILKFWPLHKPSPIFRKFSLNEGVRICQERVFVIPSECSWVIPLNIFVNILIGVLIILGLFLIYNKNKK